jgi:hypothetical protein
MRDAVSEATLAADVVSVMDKSRSRRGSAIFDAAKYPQLTEERFRQLKNAFLAFDKEASGAGRRAALKSYLHEKRIFCCPTRIWSGDTKFFLFWRPTKLWPDDTNFGRTTRIL